MDSVMESSSRLIGIKTYKYRWIVLFIFCLFTVINFMQFLQFTIISNIITKYYNVEEFAVDATGLLFFLVYILTFLPISYLIERYSLKVSALGGIGLTLAGTLVKLFSADPDRFYVVLIGQALCALGQVYMLSIPTKFACVWFGPDEVSTACAVAILGTQLGAALGSVLPPMIVNNEDSAIIGHNLFNMAMYNSVVAFAVFIIVAAFFRAKPSLPPSQSQLQLLEGNEVNELEFLKTFKILIKNKDFILLLVSMGVWSGLWNSFGILVNTFYLNYFPDGQSDVGIITAISIISGGCIGSVVFGFIMDKTHQFKLTAMGAILMSALTFIGVVYSLLHKHRIGSYITIPIFGFFTSSSLVIGFEYAQEVTYPIPESISCSVLNATIFIFSIILTLAIEGLLDAIGFLNTFIVILVVIVCTGFLLIFVSSKLRRRDANIANGISAGNINISSL